VAGRRLVDQIQHLMPALGSDPNSYWPLISPGFRPRRQCVTWRFSHRSRDASTVLLDIRRLVYKACLYRRTGYHGRIGRCALQAWVMQSLR
jgi:hypothetical protein